MDRTKKSRLEKAGWAVADASELLGLTPAEEELVEMKLALSALECITSQVKHSHHVSTDRSGSRIVCANLQHTWTLRMRRG